MLAVETTIGRRYYACPSCGGVVAGVAVFREMVGQHLGHQLWSSAMSAGTTAGTGRCPFCSLPMRPASVENGEVWVCKACEVAWLDKDAITTLAAAEGPRIEVSTHDAVPRCENCGAPLLHASDTHCSYCLAPIVRRTTLALGGEEKA